MTAADRFVPPDIYSNSEADAHAYHHAHYEPPEPDRPTRAELEADEALAAMREGQR
jgi:hypothetical protein